MKNFIFKSTDADLQKIITIIGSQLNLLEKNILYITYRVDKILKIVREAETDKGLQTQVDEYFGSSSNLEDGAKDLPDSTEI